MEKPSFFFMPVKHFAGNRVVYYYPTFEDVKMALEALRRRVLSPFAMLDTLVIVGTLETIMRPSFHGWSAISMLSVAQKNRTPGTSMQDALLNQTKNFQNVLLVGPVFSFAGLYAIVGKEQPSDELLHAIAAMTETGIPYEIILQDDAQPVGGVRNLLTDEISQVCTPSVAPAFDRSSRGASPLIFFAGGDGAMG